MADVLVQVQDMLHGKVGAPGASAPASTPRVRQML